MLNLVAVPTSGRWLRPRHVVIYRCRALIRAATEGYNRAPVGRPGRITSVAGMGMTFLATALLGGCGSTLHVKTYITGQRSAPGAALAVSYAGMDYEQPNGALTGCNYYTWLQPSCYTNSSLTTFRVSPQQQLSREMNWITANHMGSFQRVFVSLDELFSCFDATTGFCGYDSQALANLDDALSIIAAAHQKVDLVLFLEDNTAGFHFEALDGYHPQMEQSYVTAVQQFVQHVAANATDSSAISVIDLQNEAYYQIAAHLSTMTNVCGQDTGCIDHKISYPWLTQLYNTAHAAAPQFKYTASAVSSLLERQSYTLPLYAGIADVYDIHLYSGHPWTLTSELANARNLNKPWFVGEAGCEINGSTLCSYDGGNVNCTAPTACSLSVDTWWLENLHHYGASAVLVQNARTCFFSSPNLSLHASKVGQEVIKANAAY